MWKSLPQWLSNKPLSEADYEQAKRELLKETPIPLIWLFGKTGSGKSSIARFLTGVETVEIGSGFRPQTRFSSSYDFPNESEPLLSFLDTRGLGEVDYDPQEDIARFGDEAHLMIVVVRAMDHAVDEIVVALRSIRKASPQRPVILALTALHDAYPGQQHPCSRETGDGRRGEPGDSSAFDHYPENLRRSLDRHCQRFHGLYDRVVALDLTPAEEGFDDPQYGGEGLKQAVIESLPAAYRHSIVRLDQVSGSLNDLTRRRTFPIILGTSTLAATAAAVPFPWVDIPVVMGLQSHLIYKLAKIHHQSIDAQTIAQVSGDLGGRVAVQLAIRQTLKVIPWIGSVANAAAAFAYTYATGMAWNWYFTQIRHGHVPNETELREVFQKQLQRAAELWKSGDRPNVATAE